MSLPTEYSSDTFDLFKDLLEVLTWEELHFIYDMSKVNLFAPGLLRFITIFPW